MTLGESEIRVFSFPKFIKERSIGGEDIVAFRQRQRKKCERENFGEEDRATLIQKDNPKLYRRETRDFGGGTPYNINNVVQQQATLGTMPSHRFFSVIFGCFDFSI